MPCTSLKTHARSGARAARALAPTAADAATPSQQPSGLLLLALSGRSRHNRYARLYPNPGAPASHRREGEQAFFARGGAA
jgi:hypothetical protein